MGELKEPVTSDELSIQIDTVTGPGDLELAGPDQHGNIEMFFHSEQHFKMLSRKQAERLRDWLIKVLA